MQISTNFKSIRPYFESIRQLFVAGCAAVSAGATERGPGVPMLSAAGARIGLTTGMELTASRRPFL
jgi:hypothetical protein